jgi:hypothetical protein
LTIRLYMDHHVPGPITAGLRRRGIDVVTAHEDDAAELGDDALLERATQLGRVLFSQDRDLLVIAHHWLETEREFSGLIYGHQLNITIGRAVRDLELLAQVLEPGDMHNHIEFLPL